MTRIIILIFVVFGMSHSNAQLGCTDIQAINYDDNATTNDGSCSYSTTQYTLSQRATLPDEITESSGLIYLNGDLWTHNDGGNPEEIYRIDSINGSILQTLTIAGTENEDWEDITGNEDYVFLGDFGNNPGNRTDLRIARINRSNLGNLIVGSEIINFSFSDQMDFSENMNNHDYDCEAFLYYQDSLHLFTKNWVDQQTRHYVLPATPGTHVAQLRETLDVNGLITGADISDKGVISLLGYSPSGITFMWLLYDYQPNHFFSGNKRRIGLGTALTSSQTEGITFTENGSGFISSENFNFLPPRLLHFETRQWTEHLITNADDLILADNQPTIYPNPFHQVFQISWDAPMREKGQLFVFNALGQLLVRAEVATGHSIFSIDLNNYPGGMYYLKMLTTEGSAVFPLQKQP